MKYFILLLMILMLTVSNGFAKKGGGFKSPLRKSTGFKKPQKKKQPSVNFKKPKAVQKKTVTDQGAGFKKPTTKAVTNKGTGFKKPATKDGTVVKKNEGKGFNKPKATPKKNKGAGFKKPSKKQIKANKAANKKYGNRKKASKKARADLAKKNRYTRKTPPARRPSHIPQNVTINNRSYGTSYGMFPGGGYGYGYMNPLTGLFCAMAANQMIVNDQYMAQNGYGAWGAQRQVYHSNSGGLGFLYFIIGMCLVVVVGVFVYKQFNKSGD